MLYAKFRVIGVLIMLMESNVVKKEPKKLYPVESINYLIQKIRNGDTGLKEKLIHDYKPFIMKTLSNIIGEYVQDENCDEYSIGLLAFNEAIDRHTPTGNGNFFKYSEKLINCRIIDYLRKNEKYSKTIPFSYFEDSEEFETKYLTSDSNGQYDHIELKEDFIFFKKQLALFGFTLEDVVSGTPKHADSRKLCICIAKTLSEDEQLYNKMIKKKNVPLTDLMKQVDVHQRTVERNRKYIIAIALILKNHLFGFKEILINIHDISS